MESAFRRRDFVFEAGDNSSGRRQTGVMIELHSTHRGRAVMSVNTALLRTLRKNLLLESLAGAGFLAHMAVADRYGYFRDELYYIAAGHHLALGYVDFPVMIAILAWVLRGLAGDSLVAIHVIPALANAVLILVTGLITRELGGRRLAQVISSAASLVCLTFLATGSIFSMDSLDELWWTVIAYLVVRLVRRNQPRLWIVIGLVAGLGVLTKVTILFYLAALGVALVVTPARSQLRTRWPWIGAAIACAGLIPYTIWELQTGWPTLTYWHNYIGTLVGHSPLGFFAQQAYVMNPLTLPLWLAGGYWLLRGRGGRELRALGLAFVILFAWFSVGPSKSYYLAPAYPALFAAGAVLLESHLARHSRRWLGVAYVVLLGVSGVLLAPIAMPVLSPATFAEFYGFLGADGGAQMEHHQAAVLPQWLADRFGWVSLTREVGAVVSRLAPNERRQACIFTANYGEAAALDFLGARSHLPVAVSGHNSFYFWGPGSCSGRVVVTVGLAIPDVRQSFRSVRQVGTTRCSNCMPAENGLPVLVATGPRYGISELWKKTEILS